MVSRGEAPVHHNIEKLAAAGSPTEFIEEMYAGNWMRDYSQLNLPMGHGIASKLPRDIGRSAEEPLGEPIGARGAEDIITSVIRAMAHLEFGPELTNSLITPDNIGRYAPEQHVDNPMGTSAEHHLVRDTDTGELRTPQDQYPAIEDPVAGVTQLNPDADRDRELAGRGMPGLQTENPALFAVSDAGLANHIYNGAEWAKHQLSLAVNEGATPQGRAYLGSALHAVEDYFAHSNFIEVALNSEIGRAMDAAESAAPASLSEEFLQAADENRTAAGLFVDTVYGTGDEVARGPDGRLAVTTGTAGSQDLQVSVGQILLPKLPELAEKISTGIDEALGLVIDSEGQTTWEKIEEKLETDRGGAAALEVIGALDRNVTVPYYDNIDLTKRWIPWTDRFIPTGLTTPELKRGGVVTAIRSYLETYRRWDHYFDQLSPFDFIVDISKQFHALIRQKIQELKAQIRQAIMEYLVAMAEEITGIELRQKKDETIEEMLERAGSMGVEHLREGTSIESQLPEATKDMDPDLAYATFGVIDGEAQFPLPPSHSEISKDHPAHEGEVPLGPDAPLRFVDDVGEWDIEEGSLFYGLHQDLAVEADGHIIAAIGDIWDQRTEERPDERLESNPRLDVDEIRDQALRRQDQEQERAAAEGRTSAVGERSSSGDAGVLAMVDLFIAHPDDSTWWQPILTRYVNAHEVEVIRHIRARNRTREKRH